VLVFETLREYAFFPGYDMTYFPLPNFLRRKIKSKCRITINSGYKIVWR